MSLVWLACLFSSAPVRASGPKLQPPPVPVPVAYKGTARAAVPGMTLKRANWWTLFDDPTLDRLEARAAAANPGLLQAISRIEEERQRARGNGADFLPRLESNLSASRIRNSNTLAPQKGELLGGIPGLPTTNTGSGGANGPFILKTQPLTETVNDFRAPLVASYELDVFGRIRHTYAGAIATAQAAEADARAVRLSLAGDVATTYFTLRAFDTQIGILRRTLGLRHEQVRINEERVEMGAGDPLDLARARTEQASTEADLADAQRQRADQENSLAALCGETASDFSLPPRPLGERPPPAVPAGVPADLLTHRPDVAEAERRVAAATEGVGVARAEFLPRFTIQGSVGFETGDAEHLFDAQSRDLRVMPTINVPIFEGGRNAANLRVAHAVYDGAAAAYRDTVLRAFRDAESALADLRQRAVQAEAQSRAARSAQEVLDLTNDRYGKGAINYFDVVDAERSLLSIQLNAAGTLDARYAATVSLIRTLGGGWGGKP